MSLPPWLHEEVYGDEPPPPEPPKPKLLHLRIGPDTFLKTLLRVDDPLTTSWFGEAQMNELLALLLEELEERLPQVEAQRVPKIFDCSRCGDTLIARLRFIPQGNKTWLFPGEVNFGAALSLASFPYTLLIDAEQASTSAAAAPPAAAVGRSAQSHKSPREAESHADDASLQPDTAAQSAAQPQAAAQAGAHAAAGASQPPARALSPRASEWLRVGAPVYFVDASGERVPATLRAVHIDDPPNDYYTIHVESTGTERQTTADRLQARHEPRPAAADVDEPNGAQQEMWR